MSYLQDITARFPVRKRDEEKEAFRKWAVAQGKTLGYSARVEELARGRHCNVVFGSPEHAQVIYTAHYDTPARLPIPNLMTPRNIPMFALYQLGIILVLLLAAAIAFVGAQLLMRNASLSLIIALVVYYALLLLMIAGPANPNNVNDNTSGVAAVMETMARMPKEQREKAAFILFDNEEKGRLGSRAFAAANPKIKKQTLLINMDCVGVGEHILVIGQDGVRDAGAELYAPRRPAAALLWRHGQRVQFRSSGLPLRRGHRGLSPQEGHGLLYHRYPHQARHSGGSEKPGLYCRKPVRFHSQTVKSSPAFDRQKPFAVQ